MKISCILGIVSLVFMMAPATAQAANRDVDGDISPGQQWLSEYRMSVTPAYRQVASSVGTLLLVEDGPGGPLGLEMLFDREYQKIQKLPLQNRKDFFWTLMFRLHLQNYAHFSEEFFQILASDCGKEIRKDLDFFIKNGELGESELRTALSLREMLGMVGGSREH